MVRFGTVGVVGAVGVVGVSVAAITGEHSAGKGAKRAA
jgi:hypothetical protein